MTSLYSVLESRDVSLPTKVHIFKAMIFPVIMYRCESCTMKKTERQRMMLSNCGFGEDSWVPWTARRSNQSILKEITLNIHQKDWCWNWSSNTLATWCKEPIHWKRPWCWERLKAGEEGDNSGWDGWMASPTQCIWVWENSQTWWWTGRPRVLQFMGSQRVDTTGWLNWTELKEIW